MAGSPLKILVVDDSAFFRNRVSDVIDTAADMTLVGFAVDGEDAVLKAKQLKPDIITMDVQMPHLDGISAVSRIMRDSPTPILMLSMLTREGAQETLKALEAGAVDFLPKVSGMGGPAVLNQFSRTLLAKLRGVARSRVSQGLGRGLGTIGAQGFAGAQAAGSGGQQPQLVVIGASTGGPVALQKIISSLPRHFPVPVAMAVHMPSGFTSAYAERLNAVSAIQVREARDRETLLPGTVLLAPGGKQMRILNGPTSGMVRISEPRSGDLFHPSVDTLFASAAESFGNKVLGIVLTGMGSDGLQGGRKLKAAGGRLWSQDEKSCVVYGMPQAVERAGLSDQVFSIDEIGSQLVKLL
jgi:two-component system chemotaxis response regulator CheB